MNLASPARKTNTICKPDRWDSSSRATLRTNDSTFQSSIGADIENERRGNENFTQTSKRRVNGSGGLRDISASELNSGNLKGSFAAATSPRVESGTKSGLRSSNISISSNKEIANIASTDKKDSAAASSAATTTVNTLDAGAVAALNNSCYHSSNEGEPAGTAINHNDKLSATHDAANNSEGSNDHANLAKLANTTPTTSQTVASLSRDEEDTDMTSQLTMVGELLAPVSPPSPLSLPPPFLFPSPPSCSLKSSIHLDLSSSLQSSQTSPSSSFSMSPPSSIPTPSLSSSSTSPLPSSSAIVANALFLFAESNAHRREIRKIRKEKREQNTCKPPPPANQGDNDYAATLRADSKGSSSSSSSRSINKNSENMDGKHIGSLRMSKKRGPIFSERCSEYVNFSGGGGADESTLEPLGVVPMRWKLAMAVSLFLVVASTALILSDPEPHRPQPQARASSLSKVTVSTSSRLLGLTSSSPASSHSSATSNSSSSSTSSTVISSFFRRLSTRHGGGGRETSSPEGRYGWSSKINIKSTKK